MKAADPVAQRLNEGLSALGYSFSEERREAMLAYLGLLQRWNRVYNLTAVRDPVEMVTRHLLDSLAVLPYLSGPRLLDLGTGAGIPGMVLALAEPERQWVLLDRNLKKVRFLRQVLIEFKLDHVEVVHANAEDYSPKQRFTTVVARAVASLRVLLPMAVRLCEEPARVLLMKGIYPEAELNELGSNVPAPDVRQLQVPGLAGQRHLIVFEGYLSQLGSQITEIRKARTAISLN